MNSGLKIAIAALLLILLALFLGPMLVDWNHYRPEAEAWLSRESGRKVTIGGDLKVRLLPQPRLNMQAVMVANGPPPSGPALLTAAALDARIAILPLLIGGITVTSLRLDEPVLTLERRPDGRFNLGWTPLPEAGPRIIEAGFSLIPHNLMVDKIEIAKGSVRYHDAILDWSESIQAIDATALAAEDGAYQARAGFAWAGQPWTLAVDAGSPGQGGGQGGVRLLTLVLEHAAAGLKAQLTGRLGPGKGGMAWQIGGALNLQLASPSVFGASAAAWGNPAQNSAAPPLMLEGALTADPAGLTIHDTALRWGEFAAHGGLDAAFAPQPVLTIRVAGNLLNLDAVRPDLAQAARVPYWPIAALQLFSAAGAPSPEAAPRRGLGAIWQGTADVKLEAIVFAQGRIADPSLAAAFSNGVFEIKDLALMLPGDTELHVQGKTAPGGVFDGQAALAGERARELFLWAGVPVQSVEAGRLTKVAYKGGLQVAPGSMRLSDFEAGLDGSVMKGLLALSRPAASGPQIEADLQVTRMNVDPYRVLFVSDEPPLETVLKLFDSLSGPVKLAVDTLIADGYEARGLTSDLNLSAAGGVTIRSLKITDLLGAELSLAGEGKALSGAASLSLTGTSVGLDLRPLFARLGIAAPKGEAALGPSTFDIKAEIKDGSGEIAADGYLAGGKAGARLTLDKAEAPLAGRLGAGMIAIDAVAQGQNMVIAGRLAGYDPPIGKPGAASDVSGPVYMTVPAAEAQIPPGWVYLTLRRDPAGLNVTSGAALTGGKIALGFDRRGDAVSGTYAVKLEGGVPDAAALLAALGVPEAKRKAVTGSLAVALAANGPANAVALSPASFALGALKLEGDGRLDLSAAKPVLTGTLHGSAVDLDLLLGLRPRPDKSEDLPGPWSEQPLDLSVFGRYEGGLAVEADSLTIGRLPFAAPKFALALKDGTLSLSDLRASLFGGPLTANLALRGGALLPGIAASVKFIQLDSAALAATLWDERFITGELAGALSLTAQGESTAALAASAAGSLSFKSIAGTIAGLKRPNAAEPVPFIDLVIEAPIEKGVAEIKDGHLGLTDGPAAISGRAALAPFTLGLAVQAEGKPGLVALEGALDAPKRKAR